MWATNGFPGILPLPALLPPRGVYSDVKPSRATFRYLSADATSSFLSLFLSSLISVATLSTSSRSALFRRLFSVETRLHTLYHPQKPLDCEFPRRREGKFPHVEEISGLDHAIDFHASLLLVFLFLSFFSNHLIVCRIYRNRRQSKLDISRIDWNASI